MTLDEAIKHCEEVAEKNDGEAEVYGLLAKNHNSTYEKLTAAKFETDCAECATDHRQLAEWLTELKEVKKLLRLAVDDLNKMPCNNDTERPDSCYICEKHGNCNYTDSFKWCYADIAEKLLKEE